MASIHRKNGSAYWHCAFYLPDGRRTLRSTGTSNKRKAQEICLEYEQAAREARENRFTEARARAVVSSIYEIANRDKLPSSTVRDFLQNWLAQKELAVADSSHAAYTDCVNGLLAHLDTKADRPLDAITLRDLTAFRDSLARRLSGSTVNKTLKILSSAWHRALKDGLIRDNVFVRVDRVKPNRTQRRAFTLPELKRVLDECDGEWRGLVLFGLYTGQRLGDIARLTWRNADLQTNELRFTARKTHRPMVVPLAKPLSEYLLTLNAPDNPDAPIFPRVASIAAKRVGTLSNQFAKILANAGLIEKRTHESKDKGREARRDVSGLSFHCLRHTATTLLKNAGVSGVVALEIIGHESEAVSRVYTHIDTPTLRAAVDKLPDITKETKQ